MKKKVFMVLLVCLFGMSACGRNEAALQDVSETLADDSISVSEDIVAFTNVTDSVPDLSGYDVTSKEDFDYFDTMHQVEIGDYSGDSDVVILPDYINSSPVTQISGLDNKGIRVIKLSDNVMMISGFCFFGDESLETVICGNGLTFIGDFAFKDCTSLKSVYLNDGLVTICDMAFVTASKDFTDLYIPGSVSEIKGNPFPTDGSLTVHVKAGSYSEEFCSNLKSEFPDFSYIAE